MTAVYELLRRYVNGDDATAWQELNLLTIQIACAPIERKLMLFGVPLDKNHDLLQELYVHFLENDKERLRSCKATTRDGFCRWLRRTAPGGFDLKWHTEEGSAISTSDGSGDFEDVTDGVLQFDGTDGEIKDVEVTINDDEYVEKNETVYVRLDEAVNTTGTVTASFPTDSMTAIINDNDEAILTINEVGMLCFAPAAIQDPAARWFIVASLSASTLAYRWRERTCRRASIGSSALAPG